MRTGWGMWLAYSSQGRLSTSWPKRSPLEYCSIDWHGRFSVRNQMKNRFELSGDHCGRIPNVHSAWCNSGSLISQQEQNVRRLNALGFGYWQYDDGDISVGSSGEMTWHRHISLKTAFRTWSLEFPLRTKRETHTECGCRIAQSVCCRYLAALKSCVQLCTKHVSDTSAAAGVLCLIAYALCGNKKQCRVQRHCGFALRPSLSLGNKNWWMENRTPLEPMEHTPANNCVVSLKTT